MKERHGLSFGLPSSWRWHVLIAASYLIGLTYLGIALRKNVGFPLDDSWIHQVIARNLIQFHSFGFTPQVTSSGSSSTLWTFILSSNYLLFPHASPVWFPLGLNSLLLITSGMLLWHMAVLDALPLPEAVALAVIPGLSGNLVWLAFIGMEHVLFVALSLMAIILWFSPAEPDPKKSEIWLPVRTGLVLGALGMTRPEGLALSLLLFCIYKRCGRTLTDVMRTGFVTGLFLVPSFVINYRTSGTLLPVTLRGRRFLYLGTDKLHVGRSTVRSLMHETYDRILRHHYFHSTGWWVFPMVLLSFYGLFVLVSRFPNRTSVLCLWATLHYLSYCFTLPATGHGGRYQPFVLVLFPPLMAIALIGIVRFAARFAPPQKLWWRLQWVSVAVIATMTAATLSRWEIALRDSIVDINQCHRKLAYWINEHYPAGTRMGVFDIGTIGYFAKIDLIDLGGLVDRRYLPYLLNGQAPEYLDQKGAQYVILPHNGDETRFGDQLHFLHNPAIRLIPIHTEGIDPETWASSYIYTQHAFRLQTLYRIEHVPLQDQTPAATAAASAIAAQAKP